MTYTTFEDLQILLIVSGEEVFVFINKRFAARYNQYVGAMRETNTNLSWYGFIAVLESLWRYSYITNARYDYLLRNHDLIIA